MDGIPGGQKVSRRQSLEQVARSLGRMPKELADAPELQEGTEYLWLLFCDLKNAGRVSYGEMAAYQAMTGVEMTPLEVDCMRRLDEAWTRAHR